MIILRKIGFTEPNFCRGFEFQGFLGMGCPQAYLILIPFPNQLCLGDEPQTVL